MKGEKVFDAVTNIEDELIEEAGVHRFSRNRGLAWIGYAAAACLVIGASLFAVTRFVKDPADNKHAMVPNTTAEALQSETPRRVITGVKTGSLNEDTPSVGQRYIRYGLEDMIKSPEYADCLFDVEIDFGFLRKTEDYRNEQHEILMRTYSANKQWLDYYSEENENWIELRRKVLSENPDYTANDHPELYYFEVYWENNYPQDVKDAYASAKEACETARAIYLEKTQGEEMRRVGEQAVAEMLDYLSANGYELTLEQLSWGDRAYHAQLTREQIENFPVDDWGVIITWWDYEGPRDE